MKNVLLAAALVLSPSLAQAQDWSGAYGALSLTYEDTTEVGLISGVPGNTSAFNDTVGGLALGYNMQNGDWVFGGELAFTPGKIMLCCLSGLNYLEDMIDVKARVGYSFGKTMVYGTVGWAKTGRYYANDGVTNEPVGTSGMSFGLGADFLVTDNVFVGLEVQQRELETKEGTIDGFPDDSTDYTLRSIGVRLGYKF